MNWPGARPAWKAVRSLTRQGSDSSVFRYNCPMRILILDDEKTRHFIIASMLKRNKHEIFHAYSYDEAIEALAGERFDEMYLDHDIDSFVQEMYCKYELTGAHVARAIVAMPSEKFPNRVVVHSWNHDGARHMRSILQSHGIRVLLAPFNDQWV